MAVVCENPDGSAMVGISVDNPYRDIPTSNSSVLTRASELDTMARNVRFFCMVDFTLGILNFVATGYVSTILLALAAVMGWHGSSKYNKSMIFLYLMIQFVYTVFRYIILSVALTDLNDVSTVSLTVLPIMAIIQTYIFWYVLRFYDMLPNSGSNPTQVVYVV